MSELPITDLSSDSVETRLAACAAIADAVERGVPLDLAVQPVVALLADPDPRVKNLVEYILQTDAERDPRGRGVDGLRWGLSHEVEAVRRAAGFLLAGFHARQEDGGVVATLLGHADPAVRAGALKAIADGAVPRRETDPVVAALVPLLEDETVAIRKEAIWAAYLLGSEGTSLAPALPALEAALADPATQANAAIAASLAYHQGQATARADALYASESGPVQMGAAWGAADAALQRKDAGAIEALFTSDNDNLRRGLGAFLNHARKARRDVTLAGQVFGKLEAAHAGDALALARLYGVVDLAQRGAGG
ncbi:MAG: HEAT repeat domain-containing protein [Myxococcales bacterium]|nr:HEAT repeat domain-containing protein [Myxococcales bacterium]